MDKVDRVDGVGLDEGGGRGSIPRPEKILCLTFTVRAAMEKKERIRKIARHAELPELGNAHHFCHHFLYSRKLVPQKWQVIDENTQSDLMLEVTEEFPPERIKSIRDKRGEIKNAKRSADTGEQPV